MKTLILITNLIFVEIFVASASEPKPKDAVKEPAKAESSKTSKIEVSIQANDLRIDDAKSEVIWEPDRDVKRASYKTYIFALEEFRDKLGDPKDLKGTYNARIRLDKEKSGTRTPKDSSLPQPSGGFGLITYHATIEERLP
ncbi:MAG: hypothetical protein AAF585_27375 [Verrucomicrobiota bacterium]